MTTTLDHTFEVGFDTEATTELGKLIHDGSASEIQTRLSLPIKWKDEDYFPLHAALFAGRDDLALQLIELGSPILSQAFYLAERFGNPKTFTFLLKHHVEKMAGPASVSTFIDAARNGNTTVVAAVVGYVSDVNTTDYFHGFEGWTALHHAAKRCDATLAKLLLTHGAAVSQRTTKGKTPLVLCCTYDRKITRQQRKKFVHLLLEYGSDSAGDLTAWQMFWLRHGIIV